METPRSKKTRASTSEAAREYRQRGYDDALKFAELIGLDKDYKNDPQAKKDVIDPSGDAHSVKGGKKKWQIFLYGLNRFESDPFFQVMNGLGVLLSNCINAFPPTYEEYIKNKTTSKENLKPHMIEIAEKLQDKKRLMAFLSKSLFNGGEVNYLTIFDQNKFHVFWGKEVAKVMSENLEVGNSQKRNEGQFDCQKVIFKYENTNLAELEMRNDSKIHYREIRFNMVKPKAMKLLYNCIPLTAKYKDEVYIYGEANKHFGRWK